VQEYTIAFFNIMYKLNREITSAFLILYMIIVIFLAREKFFNVEVEGSLVGQKEN
jgi:hypothetical protein